MRLLGFALVAATIGLGGCSSIQPYFSTGGGAYFKSGDLYGPSTTADIMSVHSDLARPSAGQPQDRLPAAFDPAHF
jgi:hypothetical protein